VGNVGSYQYAQLQSPEEELVRLIQQAEVGLAMERQIWVDAGLHPEMRVVDLGCGPGVVSAALAEMVEGGFVHGLDASPELLEQARRIQQLRGVRNIQFSKGDVYALPTGLRDYDFAYARFLFQHLSEPQRASEQLKQVLAPGGIACLVDIDDSWLMLEPEPDGFKQFLRCAQRGQKHRGGDRNVGRKLAAYLSAAGFEDVETKIKVVTSHDLGLETFLKITTNFKHEQILPEDKIFAEAGIKDLEDFSKLPGAWGAVGVFVTTGRKPGNSDHRFKLIESPKFDDGKSK